MNKTVDASLNKRSFNLSTVSDFAPILGLALIAVFFFIVTDGKIFSPTNLKSLTN